MSRGKRATSTEVPASPPAWVMGEKRGSRIRWVHHARMHACQSSVLLPRCSALLDCSDDAMSNGFRLTRRAWANEVGVGVPDFAGGAASLSSGIPCKLSGGRVRGGRDHFSFFFTGRAWGVVHVVLSPRVTTCDSLAASNSLLHLPFRPPSSDVHPPAVSSENRADRFFIKKDGSRASSADPQRCRARAVLPYTYRLRCPPCTCTRSARASFARLVEALPSLP